MKFAHMIDADDDDNSVVFLPKEDDISYTLIYSVRETSSVLQRTYLA